MSRWWWQCGRPPQQGPAGRGSGSSPPLRTRGADTGSTRLPRRGGRSPTCPSRARPRLPAVSAKPGSSDPLVGLGVAFLDGLEERVEHDLGLEEQVLHAGAVDIAFLDLAASVDVTVEAGHQDVVGIVTGDPLAQLLELGRDGREEEVGRGEQEVDVGVGSEGRLQAGLRGGGVPVGRRPRWAHRRTRDRSR